MIEIAYMTTIHGRHEVALPLLGHLAALRDMLSGEIALRPYAVISPGDISGVITALDRHGMDFLVAQNKPVSKKHQAGLSAIRELFPKADAFMYAGSDDFLSAAWIRHAAARLAADPAAGFGPDCAWFIEAATGSMAFMDTPMSIPHAGRIPYGAGRTLGRRLLDRLDWELWPFERNSGLDTHSSMHMERCGIHLDTIALRDIPDAALVCIKTGGNIHSWQELSPAMKPIGDAEAAEVCRRVSLDRHHWRERAA